MILRSLSFGGRNEARVGRHCPFIPNSRVRFGFRRSIRGPYAEGGGAAGVAAAAAARGRQVWWPAAE